MKQSGHDFQTALLPCIVQISGFLVDTVHCSRVSYGPRRNGGTSVHSVDRSIIDHSAETDLWGFCLGDAVFGPVLVLAVLKSRVILYADAIEASGLFGARRLLRSEIGGKMVIFTGCQTIVLYPKSRNHRKMMVSVVFPTDQTFDG
jgi:hypothetical protein